MVHLVNVSLLPPTWAIFPEGASSTRSTRSGSVLPVSMLSLMLTPKKKEYCIRTQAPCWDCAWWLWFTAKVVWPPYHLGSLINALTFYWILTLCVHWFDWDQGAWRCWLGSLGSPYQPLEPGRVLWTCTDPPGFLWPALPLAFLLSAWWSMQPWRWCRTGSCELWFHIPSLSQ